MIKTYVVAVTVNGHGIRWSKFETLSAAEDCFNSIFVANGKKFLKENDNIIAFEMMEVLDN